MNKSERIMLFSEEFDDVEKELILRNEWWREGDGTFKKRTIILRWIRCVELF